MCNVPFFCSSPHVGDLDPEATSFSVTLNRVDTSDDLSVNLTLTSDDGEDISGLYSVPASVSFAAGKNTTSVNIGYNPADMEYDDFKNVTLSVADASYTTPYGPSSYSFSVGVPAPYRSLGIGYFTDNVVEPTYGLEGACEVEIMQNELNPNQFRIMHPYDEIVALVEGMGGTVFATDEYIEVTVMQPGDNLSGIQITQPDLVYFTPTSTGVTIFSDVPDAATEIWHPAHFGGSYAAEEAWTHSRVTAYQDNGLPGIIQLAPMYYVPSIGGGSSQITNDNIVVIQFPGYVQTDYSVSVNYTGAFVSSDGESFAMGNVTLGEDVANAKVAVVEGDNGDNALNLVLSGAVETVDITESGEVRVPCVYSGDCTMIVVAYDAEGNIQNYAYDTFNYALNPGEWRTIGNGLYTDYVLAPWFLSDADGNPAPAPTYSVQVQENIENPGVYRVMNPYHPDNYYYQISGGSGYDESNDYHIVIDAHDPDAVFIQSQPIGIDGGYLDQAMTQRFGLISVLTVGGMYIDGGNDFETVKSRGLINGKLENGVVTFAPRELLMGGTMTDQMWYCGVEDMNAEDFVFLPTTVLVLPEAVTAEAKAKAVNYKKPSTVIKKFDAGKGQKINRNRTRLTSSQKFNAKKGVLYKNK